MRLIYSYFTILFFSLILFSCSERKVNENQVLKNEVIAIHDEVMPYMGELKTLRKKVNEKAEILVEEDSLSNSEKVIELRILAKNLDDAFEGMFIWMRQFKNSYEEMNEEEIESYLLEQKKMVIKVRDDINSSMKAAKDELEEV
ncbi:hypothetical protein Belba_0007 [Belliella baltica DSM 15883]|uniref:Viral A-type inclusion protein n=1 Tax=Belliella baltica (strain DSM 15883 / CIP 108006 / LMG 21964 / BA134) TaxID=866536 RepID=I3Z0B1_BELBD|nr:hypothetical protein [Belliella baltica]AFL82679.1 hypothetical protein Belba_0007 [Belliella baltica DSM 15883]